MSDILLRINTLSEEEARSAFQRCCGAMRWAEAMTAHRPYATQDEIEALSESLWASFSVSDWREAFRTSSQNR